MNHDEDYESNVIQILFKIGFFLNRAKIVDKLHAGIGHLRCGIAIKFFILLRCRDSYSQYLEITKSDVISQTKCNNEEEYFICNFDFDITLFNYSV